ncbi:hypothetical protein BDU57DRAFT_515096 [Ampelomyces quisqualis]|uniref:RING-type domain-containing protein n=1 Tax=Ampelomyces quisqualis TaxID=50730 RepID=A0A6A5QU93_AMPQU|nr:hypothetical protein BDU57DRAFT_515096 [Ampelomyces quisqualis]
MSSTPDRRALRSRPEFLMTGIIPLLASASHTADICPICHDLLERDAVRMVGCRHTYHCTCLVPWLQGSDRCNRTCPTCRKELYTETPEAARPPAHGSIATHIDHTTNQQPHIHPPPTTNSEQDGITADDLERRQQRERLERRQRHQRERDAQHERHRRERRQQRERQRLAGPVHPAVQRSRGHHHVEPAPPDARAQRLARRNRRREDGERGALR